VEPEGVVEANNDLVQVAREEEAEILRVLAALTDAVREQLPELERLVEDLGRLDCIFARAELADRMEATEPVVSDEHAARAFGAFVKQLKEVLEQVDDRSLVLLDELGAGTDPDEGAALAQAALEALAERGALCVASTHLEPLKGFASSHPKARNASVEFDTE